MTARTPPTAAAHERLFPGHVSTPAVTDPERLMTQLASALGGAGPQVKGHVAANLNVDNNRPLLIAALTVGYPRMLHALATVDAIAPAAASRTTSTKEEA
ncbi:hypothetical protein [Streptomyces sp. NPDC060035]|uniref:hypothetical protein n=1 Tax=Streptomyces sp. NPDC060035 TaxID=3347044 RepID=UPI0036AE8D8F